MAKKKLIPVAFYGRVSTTKQDASSIPQQLKQCQRYAKANGMKIVMEFSDNKSGASRRRPGYNELLSHFNTDSSEPPFEGVICSEMSRLFRDITMQQEMLGWINWHSMFVQPVNGHRVTSQNDIGTNVTTTVDQQTRQVISERTTRGVHERADKAFSAGSTAYGYTRPADITLENGEKVKQVRQWHKHEPCEETAPVVVRIFERYADGISPKAIAMELNDEGVPSPGAHWNRSRKGGKATDGLWRASSINHMLTNEIYHGVYVYNKTQWKRHPETGIRKKLDRPKSEWKRQDVPHAKIIPTRLWNRVQARRAEVYKKSVNIRRALGVSNRGPGARPKHLLSGLLKCSDCGSNFVIRDGRSYMCASQCNGAKIACSNTVTIPKMVAEFVITREVCDEFLQERQLDKLINTAIKQAVAKAKKLSGDKDQVATLQGKLDDVEQKMENLADAIANLGFTPALRKKHDALEAEHKRLTDKLAQANSNTKGVTKEADLIRKATVRLREELAALPAFYNGIPKAKKLRQDMEAFLEAHGVEARPAAPGPEYRARVKAALEGFLGEVPVNPDGQAVLRPLDRPVYISGSGGRI